MRRIKTLFVFIGFCMVLQNPVSAQLPYHRADVKDIMKKVADWQIKNSGILLMSMEILIGRMPSYI